MLVLVSVMVRWCDGDVDIDDLCECSVSRASPACPPLHFPANLKHNKRPFYSTKQSIQSHHIFYSKFPKSTHKWAGNEWGRTEGNWGGICGAEEGTYCVFESGRYL